jgi:hypothetical protein
MAIRIISALFIASGALLLSACPANSLEGDFSPSCMAFAGDTIALKNGKFAWDKFTDQVRIGADGKKVDQFPDHPVKGTYTTEEHRVTFHPNSGLQPDFSYWVAVDDDIYLFTADEMQEWQATGAVPRCALVFSQSSSN